MQSLIPNWLINLDEISFNYERKRNYCIAYFNSRTLKFSSLGEKRLLLSLLWFTFGCLHLLLNDSISWKPLVNNSTAIYLLIGTNQESASSHKAFSSDPSPGNSLTLSWDFWFSIWMLLFLIWIQLTILILFSPIPSYNSPFYRTMGS